MTPSRRRTDGSRGFGLPNQLTCPAVGVAAVASMRSRVVFPEPFGPIRPMTSPAASLSVMSKTPLPPRKARVRPVAISGLGSEAVSAFMKIAGLDPLLDDDIHNLCRDPLLAERLGVALDRGHHLSFDKWRHVLEPLLGIRFPGHLWALLLQRLRDFVPHLELDVHRFGGDHWAEPLLGRRPLDPPATQLPAIGGQVGEPCLRFGRPGEMMLERFGAERVSVADLDPQPLEEGGIDRLRGSRGPGFGGVLGELAGA